LSLDCVILTHCCHARKSQLARTWLDVIKEGDKNPEALCSKYTILSLLASVPDEYTPLSAYFKWQKASLPRTEIHFLTVHPLLVSPSYCITNVSRINCPYSVAKSEQYFSASCYKSCYNLIMQSFIFAYWRVLKIL